MFARIERLPFLLVLMGIGAFAMLVPAIHAYQVRDLDVARSFLYSACLFGVLTVLLALAVGDARPDRPVRDDLMALVGALMVLPVMLAIPFQQAGTDITLLDAWFEMVSSLTTTGATMYPGADRLPPSLHLWRGIVGWLGGLLFWVSALAIFAPLNLGGFEVVAAEQSNAARARLRETRQRDASQRLGRYFTRLVPIYVALTLTLWVMLVATGMTPLRGAIHAMSTLSTSGIILRPATDTSLASEFFIFIFLLFAISRLSFSSDNMRRTPGYLWRDPEVRLAATIIALVPVFLFLRHWIASFEYSGQESLGQGIRVLWGGVFTTLSYLTTTGFESSAFVDARNWSGLETPGLILMGLALMGGGVATTAGGVKLLRVYALYRHGAREMERLIHPSSVGGSGSTARRLRREGAFVAWIFFMLFAMSVAVVTAALSLVGSGFEQAIVLAVASLSTTGPLAHSAPASPVLYGTLTDAARVILALAMVLGRLETLAFIALFNRDFWRD
ncbi:TrkH family potassium uptake protein [Maribius pontilimi]|uniref:TrkH family potassium uptake protein n=1 Tax=Palleronia pontilimi TaxID=1964209 RepID=A0A934IJ68_9RHOB|nr:TrkH family potassium uptake protein [Palleronia pontilimi]MBJ3762914.1 TrkH family potassium uptake protein [Palleronia pontilimi]